MKVKKSIGLILIVMVFMMTSCNNKEVEETEASGFDIYYKNNSDSELVPESYNAKATTTDNLVQELIAAMNEEPESLSYKKAKPDSVEIKTVSLVSNKEVTIDFASNYMTLDLISEILCRGAIVKTLCQISGVEYVVFTVEGKPLLDQYQKPIGIMKNDDFVVLNDKANFSQDARFYLYFSNAKGNALIGTRVKVTYDSTKSMEQLAIEYLIQGPSHITGLNKTIRGTIPANTNLIKTSTNKSGTCTVDLDEDFLNIQQEITDEVVIYSIVNTLMDIPGVKKVQFLIKGEKKKIFGKIKNFDKEFDRNLDIIQ